jgi:DNA-binding MarR family transcriptional regulator
MTNYRLHASLGYNLSLASRLQERRLDESLKTLLLTRTTWCVLLAVGNEALHQPSDIADFVGIDRTATSRALRNMESAGLLTRETGSADRRTTRVALTDLGRQRISEGTPFALQNNAVMRAKLSAEEHAELMGLLAKLTEGEDTGLSNL